MAAPASFQQNYPFNMPKGVAGRIADCGFKNTLSPQCLETIPAAVGVMKPYNVDYKVMLPRNDTASSVFSADLITDNVVNATVNGVAIDPVTYASSHLDTMQAVADAIQDIPSVASAVVGGANNRTITIISVVGVATDVTVFTVTSGDTQATITTTESQSGVFFGVTQSIYNKMNQWMPNQGPNLSLSSGIPNPYFQGEVAPTLTQGRIYVVPEDVVTSNSPVYVRIEPKGDNLQLGAFRSDDDSGTAVLLSATEAIWREGNGTVGEVAVLELNIP